jgi:hypothetical protein
MDWINAKNTPQGVVYVKQPPANRGNNTKTELNSTSVGHDASNRTSENSCVQYYGSVLMTVEDVPEAEVAIPLCLTEFWKDVKI